MICQFELLCWRVRYILGEFHAIRQIAIMQLAVFYELIVCCISHFELCHFTDLKHCISAAIVTKNERQNQITTVDGRNSAPVHRWFIPLFRGFYTSLMAQDFWTINSMKLSKLVLIEANKTDLNLPSSRSQRESLSVWQQIGCQQIVMGTDPSSNGFYISWNGTIALLHFCCHLFLLFPSKDDPIWPSSRLNWLEA